MRWAAVWLGALIGSSAGAVDLARLDYQLKPRQIAPATWVIEGAVDDFSRANGCNIINTAMVSTTAGTLVINTGPSRLYGEQQRAALSRLTSQPVKKVVSLNLHPDYFLGNQAFADVPRLATAATRAGIEREAAAYETNLYRLCGDWMKGTQALAPDTALTVPPDGRWRLGTRDFELRALSGHTASDLVLLDRRSGVMFAGGLVFAQRVPTTPHAQVDAWLQSLRALPPLAARLVVPSHGPVHADGSGIQQTQRYLEWLDGSFRSHARQGLDMNEVLRAPVPAEFRGWAAFDSEYVRNVAHLYPRYERALLPAAAALPPRAGR